MLLSCGANARQSNTSGKEPVHLISSKEMSNVFNMHGVKHAAFDTTDKEVSGNENATVNTAEKVVICSFHLLSTD